MAHYLFNYVKGDVGNGSAAGEGAVAFLRAGMWGVGADEPHRDALAPGDVGVVGITATEYGAALAVAASR